MNNLVTHNPLPKVHDDNIPPLNARRLTMVLHLESTPYTKLHDYRQICTRNPHYMPLNNEVMGSRRRELLLSWQESRGSTPKWICEGLSVRRLMATRSKTLETSGSKSSESVKQLRLGQKSQHFQGAEEAYLTKPALCFTAPPWLLPIISLRSESRSEEVLL